MPSSTDGARNCKTQTQTQTETETQTPIQTHSPNIQEESPSKRSAHMESKVAVVNIPLVNRCAYCSPPLVETSSRPRVDHGRASSSKQYIFMVCVMPKGREGHFITSKGTSNQKPDTNNTYLNRKDYTISVTQKNKATTTGHFLKLANYLCQLLVPTKLCQQLAPTKLCH